MRRSITLFLVAGFLLGGCASTGTNFNPNAVSQLHAGMTESDVIVLMGHPNGQSSLPNGGHILVWMHSTGTAFGTGEARSVSVLIGPDGTMQRVLNETSTSLH